MSNKDRAAYNEYMRNYMRARYRQRRTALVEAKGGVCVDCGTDARLELDHADRSEKLFDVGDRLAGGSAARLDPEVAKIVLRCRACHARKSVIERGQEPGGRCGTVSKYQRGCRCDPCIEARKAARTRWAENKRLRAVVPTATAG